MAEEHEIAAKMYRHINKLALAALKAGDTAKAVQLLEGAEETVNGYIEHVTGWPTTTGVQRVELNVVC